MDRTEKFLVVDVETANDVKCPLVYDIGFVVTNRHGEIFEAKHFIVEDIFCHEEELLRTCYYSKKIPEYYKLLADKKCELVNFYSARQTILYFMRFYKITKVGAFNCYFDRFALNNTFRWLTKSKYRYFFPRGTDFFCIWHMACQVICTQKKYLRFCFENMYYSNRGAVKTNAETIYRYYLGTPNFDEKHMGLDDVVIETFILEKCYAQHKKMDTGINRMCWQIPQKAEM